MPKIRVMPLQNTPSEAEQMVRAHTAQLARFVLGARQAARLSEQPLFQVSRQIESIQATYTVLYGSEVIDVIPVGVAAQPDTLTTYTPDETIDNVEAKQAITHLVIELLYSLTCLLYTSPSPRDGATSRMPSSA